MEQLQRSLRSKEILSLLEYFNIFVKIEQVVFWHEQKEEEKL